LDVVPVQVAQQARTAERRVLREAEAEVPQAGAEVEHDRWGAGRVDRDARRVPSVARGRLAVARSGPADAVERELYAVPPDREKATGDLRAQGRRSRGTPVTPGRAGRGAVSTAAAGWRRRGSRRPPTCPASAPRRPRRWG